MRTDRVTIDGLLDAIVYELVPMECWAGWSVIQDGVDDLLREYVASALRDIEKCAGTCDWDGGPYLSPLPDGEGDSQVLVAAKAVGNGSAYVWSPFALPWLDTVASKIFVEVCATDEDFADDHLMQVVDAMRFPRTSPPGRRVDEDDLITTVVNAVTATPFDPSLLIALIVRACADRHKTTPTKLLGEVGSLLISKLADEGDPEAQRALASYDQLQRQRPAATVRSPRRHLTHVRRRRPPR